MNDVKAQADGLPVGLPADGAAAGCSGDPEQVKERIMKSSNSYLAAAFVIAFSVLLIIPMWAAYGVMFPKEGGGHSHGAGETPMASEFEEKTARFIEAHRLPDSSVRAEHGKPVYAIAMQYAFRPDTIRLTVGEQYDLQMLSTDMVHNFSIQMGDASSNAVVMPKMVTDLKPPTALIPGVIFVLVVLILTAGAFAIMGKSPIQFG